MTQEEKDYIKAEYIKNEKSIREIASDLALTYAAVNGFLKRAKKKGEISAEHKRVVRYKRPEVAEKKYVLQKVKKAKGIKPTTLKPGKSINCTKKVAATCFYGLQTEKCGLCNYQEITGTSRILVSPDPKHCTVYVKKERKRTNGKGQGI